MYRFIPNAHHRQLCAWSGLLAPTFTLSEKNLTFALTECVHKNNLADTFCEECFQEMKTSSFAKAIDTFVNSHMIREKKEISLENQNISTKHRLKGREKNVDYNLIHIINKINCDIRNLQGTNLSKNAWNWFACNLHNDVETIFFWWNKLLHWWYQLIYIMEKTSMEKINGSFRYYCSQFKSLCEPYILNFENYIKCILSTQKMQPSDTLYKFKEKRIICGLLFLLEDYILLIWAWINEGRTPGKKMSSFRLNVCEIDTLIQCLHDKPCHSAFFYNPCANTFRSEEKQQHVQWIWEEEEKKKKKPKVTTPEDDILLHHRRRFMAYHHEQLFS